MKIVLIFPPASDPAHPPLGIASLSAVLRDKGESVHLLDLNILAYHYLLSTKHLDRCAARMGKRKAELTMSGGLPLAAAEEYRLIAENCLSADYLRKAVPQALMDLRDPATYADRRTYQTASNLVRRGMEFVSAAHYPVRWYPRGFSMSHLPTRSADVLAAVSDHRQNLFIPFFESWVARIVGLKPDLIGLSINYYCQLIPAITLAAMLRAVCQVPLIAGGGLLCFFEKRWSVLAPFSHLLDGCIPFEGEIPLAGLVRALKGHVPLSSVPGVLSFNETSAVYTPPGPPPDPAGLPAPDFQGLPLDRYLTPKLVLPLLATRGCYWGRCAFCSHDQLYRGSFRRKSSEQVYREVRWLCKKFDAAVIYFADEALPPALLRDFSRRVREGPEPVLWLGEIRLEPAIGADAIEELYLGGCRMLIFGLESYSARVLNLMHKGTRPEDIERIIGDLRRAGIAFNLQFFFGFPGETRADADKTAAFVKRQAHGAATFSFGLFELQKGSAIEQDAVAHGLTAVDRTAGPLAIRFDYLPPSAHAAQIRTELRTALRRKMPFPYAGLSINAHTLVYLHRAGTTALARLYRSPIDSPAPGIQDEPSLMDRPLPVIKKQSIGTFRHSPDQTAEESESQAAAQTSHILLYDYADDRVVEISPLSAWLLSSLDPAATPKELADRLAAELNQSAPTVYRQILTAVHELYRNRLVDSYQYQSQP
jgi:hypothetical protein